MGEGTALSFVRSEDFLEGLKWARDIWEVDHFGGQLSRTYCKKKKKILFLLSSHLSLLGTDSEPRVFVPKKNVLRQALTKARGSPQCVGTERV